MSQNVSSAAIVIGALMVNLSQCPAKGKDGMCVHHRLRSACASVQSLIGILWVAEGPLFLQAEN